MKSTPVKFQTLLAELNTENTKDNFRLLVEHSTRIASSLLSKNYKYEVTKFSFLQISLTDLASDAIVPLFIKD